MTAIATTSLDALAESIDAWKPDLVVSVRSPGRGTLLIPTVPVLPLAFHDIEAAFDGRMDGPSPRHLGVFLDVLGLRPGRLLIHCTQGLSRSPALALVAAVALTPEDACRRMSAAHPKAAPNRRVLALGGAALGVGTALVAAASPVFAQPRARYGAVGLPAGFRLPFPGLPGGEPAAPAPLPALAS
ncbi:protein tyrosine phosphatase-like protein [Methylobacterium sp. 4-46]|uniref:protein tyrosine phosphatase-like protein n=1 Tax=Methylobacterium sp. (strain 4-46) TaxID=426117 RepID=UPI000152DF45|nr:protein tyrosine phosphatase-like protein [Methylobacterium sp. 4-46]ACA18505.1 protein tyrosine phosphatase-like protein [Methylobacterium sp. 4-46]